MVFRTLIILLFMPLFSSCVSKTTVVDLQDDLSSQPSGTLQISADYLKYHPRVWVGHFTFENIHDGSVVLEYRDIRCYMGNEEGRIRHDRKFNIGERTIDFSRKQVKQLKLKCLFDHAAPAGNIRLVINQIYDNPANDGGRTKGKILAKDFEWIYPVTGSHNHER